MYIYIYVNVSSVYYIYVYYTLIRTYAYVYAEHAMIIILIKPAGGRPPKNKNETRPYRS